MRTKQTKSVYKNNPCNLRIVLTVLFFFISNFFSAQVFSTDDNIITIQSGTVVVGFSPSPAVEKTEISIVGTAIIFGKENIYNGKIVATSKYSIPKETTQNKPKNTVQLYKTKATKVKPELSIRENPISSELFVSGGLAKSVITTTSFQFKTINNFWHYTSVLVGFLVLLCVIISSAIFQNITSISFRVRPPPFF
jgi:hypothetical protein